MKLYIPTSSLNFNNILSTESISPKDFYEKRGFGYSRWYTIPENDIPSVILLYENPRMFTRPKSDMEDHPLLVEYESDEDFPPCEDGIQYTDKTIYLDPWHTRFIFFSKHNMDVALSLSDSSLETKLLRLYRRKVVVPPSMPFDGQYPIINKSKLNVLTNNEQIEFDRKVNKMKGLLYGYYIGAYLSISDGQLLDKMNILREISNIFASVISSIDKTPSAMQMDRLSSLFISMHKDDPKYNKLKEIIDDEIKTNRVLNFLEEIQRPVFDDDWRSLVNGMRYSPKGEERAISWVNGKLDELNRQASIKRVPLSVDKEEIITTDCKLNRVSDSVIKDATLLSVYITWINEVLGTNEYKGKISPLKEKLSDALTLKAKDVLGDAWQGSAIQAFMNQLRHHIRGEEFNQPWDNGVLSSVASCLIKGDDWEQMLLFMQSKGMTDYRIAFSFFGVLNGFANLTRDFTDLLLNLERNYVSDVYKEFAGQLLGVTINTSPEPEMGEVVISSVPYQEKTTNDLNCEKDFENYINNKRGLHDKEKYLNSLKGIGGSESCWKLLQNLLKCPQWKVKTQQPCSLWKELAEHFCPNEFQKWLDEKGTSKKKSTNKQQMLDFTEGEDDKHTQITPTQENFALIPFCYENIEMITGYISKELNINTKAMDLIKEDLKWVLDHRYIANNTPENLLNNFIKKIVDGKTQELSSKGKDMKWKQEQYKNIVPEKIKDIILSTCNITDGK